MATILLAWELGAGLGHMVRLLPLAQGLARRGHRVFVALRDLSRAHRIFGQVKVALLQAPASLRKRPDEIKRPLTYAHLLHNVGFGDEGELAALGAAWRNLYAFVKPDALVLDHSPTALLASRGLPARRVLVGSGFFCPPDESPLRILRPRALIDQSQLCADERRIVGNMNGLAKAWGAPTLNRMTQLYADVDACFLTTFPELDHFEGRSGGRYVGAWTRVAGQPTRWPPGRGAKVYAYFKPFKALDQVLRVLRRMGNPTLIFADGLDPELRREHAASNIRFEDQPLDLDQVARECGLAVLNANHGTTINLLMHGVPTLQVPITLEQALFAQAVRRLGAGLAASSTRGDMIERQFESMLASQQYAAAARNFAARYANFDVEAHNLAIVEEVEALATGAAQKPARQPAGVGPRSR